MKGLTEYIMERIRLISPSDIKRLVDAMELYSVGVKNEDFPNDVKGEPKIEIVNKSDGRHLVISNVVWYEIPDQIIEITSSPFVEGALPDLLDRLDHTEKIEVRIRNDNKKPQVILEPHYKDGLKSHITLDCSIKKVKTLEK